MKNNKVIGEFLSEFEQSSGIRFNRFQIPEEPKYVEPKKSNLRTKLKQAERKQRKLNELQGIDPEKAKEMKMKRAIQMAQGIKKKDDPKIKKAIKRKQNVRKRHKKVWAERVNQT
jgi:hypothetical protein